MTFSLDFIRVHLFLSVVNLRIISSAYVKNFMMNKFIANGFSTVLPDGWADRSVLTLVAQDAKDGFASNVVVLRQEVSGATSVEDYAQEQIRAVAASVENFDLLDERPAAIQGKSAYQTLQRFAANGEIVQQAQTFILYNRTIFVFTCTALLREFDAAIPAFRAVMDNLAFED